MNGQDKGLIIYQGRTLIEHLLDAFSPQVSSLIISANRNQSSYQQYTNRVYSDEIGEYSGPLAGIATALRHCETDWLVCLPCDAVNIPDDFVSRLLQHTQNPATKLCIADDGSRQQPLHAIIHRNLLNDLESYLANGDKRVMQWVKQQKANIVDFSDKPEFFQNINSLDVAP